MTKVRKGGWARLSEARSRRRKKTYAEYTLEDLELREQEGGYAAWCKDGISGDYSASKHWAAALTKTRAEIDAELTDAMQNLNLEGLEIDDEQ